MTVNNIALFCAASNEIDPCYQEAARTLGEWIGSHGKTLVYGGAKLGLMEETATAVKQQGGNIVGVMPAPMLATGRGSKLPDQMIEVATLSERKEKMVELADIFVALAGGVGTLDEVFDVLAAAQVGFHSKPLIFCNTNGFYTPLLSWLDTLHATKFTPLHKDKTYFVANNVAHCIAIIENILIK